MSEPDPKLNPSAVWPRPAASTAVFRDGAVLLVARSRPPNAHVWSLPGGKIEPGEPARAAAVREVFEETGVTVRIDGLVDIHDVVVHDHAGALSAHYVLAVFHGRWLAGEPVAASDAADARFVALDDLASVELTSGARELIARACRLAG